MDEIKARQRGAKIPHVPEDSEEARRFARAFNTIDVAKVARTVDALAAVDAELTELREARAERDRLRALLAAYGRAVEDRREDVAAALLDIEDEAAKWREWG